MSLSPVLGKSFRSRCKSRSVHSLSTWGEIASRQNQSGVTIHFTSFHQPSPHPSLAQHPATSRSGCSYLKWKKLLTVFKTPFFWQGQNMWCSCARNGTNVYINERGRKVTWNYDEYFTGLEGGQYKIKLSHFAGVQLTWQLRSRGYRRTHATPASALGQVSPPPSGAPPPGHYTHSTCRHVARPHHRHQHQEEKVF